MESTQSPPVGTGPVVAEQNTHSEPKDSSREVYFTHRCVRFAMVIVNKVGLTSVQCNHKEHMIKEVLQCPQHDHLMCRNCCFPSQETTPQLCPVHKAPVFYDKFRSREICSETVTCPANTTFAATCPWSGQYKEVTGHLDACTFIPGSARVTMQNAMIKAVEQRAEQKYEELKKETACQIEQIKKESNDRFIAMERLFDQMKLDLTHQYEGPEYLMGRRSGLPINPAASPVTSIYDQEPLFCKGELIWPIENFSSKLQLAKTNALHRCIVSPPFWTSVSGYKMRLRLYPNGDGGGLGFFISIYFQIMEGQFDALLEWPFDKVITFTILGREERSFSSRIRCNPQSNSFRRPRQGPNMATGCPQFLLQQDLQGLKDVFLHEDTLYIKAAVI